MEHTLEEVLRGWYAKDHKDLDGRVSLFVDMETSRVYLSLATKQDYSNLLNLQVTGNTVVLRSQSVPPKGE